MILGHVKPSNSSGLMITNEEKIKTAKPGVICGNGLNKTHSKTNISATSLFILKACDGKSYPAHLG